MLGENCYSSKMSQAMPQSSATALPVSRRIAAGQDWSLSEFFCHAGPGDRPFEESHSAFSISVVRAGSFNYTADTGRALLHPGALLLGNHGACYQCGHDHSTGDHCLSAQFSPAFFAEMAATAAGSSRFRFPVAMLPVSRAMLPETVLLEASNDSRDPLQTEENLLRFLTATARTLSGCCTSPQRVSAFDARRISRTLRYLEKHMCEPLDLDALAAVAAMSKFYFLRVFRQTTGQTPYQLLLDTRLRRASLRLLTAPDSIASIVYESGFGDLSTFNRTFRARFGMSPSAFRRQG
jgi:AraC family transcriptional regulator